MDDRTIQQSRAYGADVMQEDFYGMLSSDVADAEGSLFREPGPFDESTEERDQVTELLGRIIWAHEGRAQAITIAELTRKTGRDARWIKDAVASLVMLHNVMIGATRQADGAGYFIVIDREDLKAACGPYEAQIATMAKRVEKLRDLAAARGIFA